MNGDSAARRQSPKPASENTWASRASPAWAPIEEISWAVGYEDPASFRRLFKRLAGITAGEYRRRFWLPGAA